MTRNQIDFYAASENERHNRVTEKQGKRQLKLTRRNIRETERSHKANEAIERGKLSETNRHNLVYEGETNRHNLKSEELEGNKLWETSRHNRETEGITSTYNDAIVGIKKLEQLVDQSKSEAQQRLWNQQISDLQGKLDLAYKEYELDIKNGRAERAEHWAKTIQSLSNSIGNLIKTISAATN